MARIKLRGPRRPLKKRSVKRLKPRRKRAKSRKGFKLLTGGPVEKV
tara:strand:- start:55 stop:192 length:138 start_codon:yes stop_codon:yes gene_type:complete